MILKLSAKNCVFSIILYLIPITTSVPVYLFPGNISLIMELFCKSSYWSTRSPRSHTKEFFLLNALAFVERTLYLSLLNPLDQKSYDWKISNFRPSTRVTWSCVSPIVATRKSSSGLSSSGSTRQNFRTRMTRRSWRPSWGCSSSQSLMQPGLLHISVTKRLDFWSSSSQSLMHLS